MLIQHYTREKKPSRENSRHSAREIKISTRENYSNSARENSGPPVKIFKKVGVKVKFPPVKKNQKTAKNGFHGHFDFHGEKKNAVILNRQVWFTDQGFE